MYNILDYIKFRGDLEVAISPFNAVDNLILSRLAYIDFGDVNGDESLSAIAARYENNDIKWQQMEFTIEETRPLLKLCGKTKRFGKLIVKDYIDIVDTSKDIQFCAMTFILDADTIYVAFRGTDESIVGWKEDFNMIYLDEVAGHREAHKYLERALAKTDAQNIYVGGHSKGGNLAVYAAVNVSADNQDKINGVFNNDGPGFKQRLSGKVKYERIRARIHTLVPENSIVGVLFTHDEQPTVVRSDNKRIFEHGTFAWQVMGADFEYQDAFSQPVKVLDKTIKNTLKTMATDERKLFVDMVFSAIDTAGIKSIIDLDKNRLQKLYRASSAYNAMDKANRDIMDTHVNRFFEEGVKNFVQVHELNKIGSKIDAWIRKFFSNNL